MIERILTRPQRAAILVLLFLSTSAVLWFTFRESVGELGQPIRVTESEECMACGFLRQRTITSTELPMPRWVESSTEASDWLLALDDGAHDHSWMRSQVSREYESGRSSLVCNRPPNLPRELHRAHQSLDQDPRLMALAQEWLNAWETGEPDIDAFRERRARLQSS